MLQSVKNNNYAEIEGNLQETDNIEITRAQELVKKKIEKLKVAGNDLKNVIKEQQIKCEHDWQKITEKVKDYGGFFGYKEILKKLFCQKCLAVRTKPDKSIYSVCQCCWGKMKDDGICPGQGGRSHHYKCIECGNEEYHT